MKGATRIQQLAVCLAVIGLCVPQVAFSANPAARPAIADVQMQDGGVLLGQVVTSENAPVANAPVQLQTGKAKPIVAKTDKNGYFAFSGLTDQGVYQLVSAKGQGTYRVWSKELAPPAAGQGALIVANNGTLRGQHGMGTFKNLMTNPFVVAAIVATAIAVPVAIHNSNSSPSSP